MPRATRMHEVVAHREDGSPVTVAARICEHLRIGGYVEQAARRANISKQSVYNWLKIGARVEGRLEQGDRLSDLTGQERKCLDFARAIDAAEAEGQAFLLELAERLSAGGFEMGHTVERYDVDGNLVERTTRRETALPDGAMIRWRLERRWPELYGRRVVEVSGPEGGPIPIEERARSLAEAATAYLQGVEDGATADDRE